MNPYEFVDARRNDFLEELKELLRIPSISTLSEHKPDIRRAAEWLKTHFESIGMTRAEIFETPGNPMVYAEWIGKPDAPTVLVYGHYDVQPADDAGGLWLTDPFVPEIRDDKLYARGATDDKGQTFVQIKAAQALIASGHMPVNIKFIIEGEEESGSNQVHHFVTSHADMLKTDVVLVSDSGMPSLQQPTIVTGLRGMLYVEIEVQGPAQDLHSGMYGGVVHNPAQALCEILAALHDSQGHITVPGFYDRVRVLTDTEREAFSKMPLTPERLEHETGVTKPWGEPEYALHERIGIRPTLEINGLVGGWIGEGAKTVLPARAMAKVSCRLVPDQQPEEILALLRAHVANLTPDTVTSTVRLLHHGMWAVVDTDSAYMAAAVRAYEFGFGARPVFVREGGSIPVVGTFQKELNAPVIMMGFGLQDDNLHGPNEKFSLECFKRGMKTAIHFYEDIGQ
jgi:acetylornithine deacetylase/succinyl-diaminopimelate desuccinylase-like protein